MAQQAEKVIQTQTSEVERLKAMLVDEEDKNRHLKTMLARQPLWRTPPSHLSIAPPQDSDGSFHSPANESGDTGPVQGEGVRRCVPIGPNHQAKLPDCTFAKDSADSLSFLSLEIEDCSNMQAPVQFGPRPADSNAMPLLTPTSGHPTNPPRPETTLVVHESTGGASSSSFDWSKLAAMAQQAAEGIHTWSSEVERLKTNLTEEKDKNECLKIMFVEVKDNNECLKTMIAEEKDKYEHLKTMLADEKDKNERLKAMLVEEEDKIGHLKAMLTEEKDKCERLKTMLADEKNENERLKINLAEEEDKDEPLKSMLLGEENKNERLKTMCNSSGPCPSFASTDAMPLLTPTSGPAVDAPWPGMTTAIRDSAGGALTKPIDWSKLTEMAQHAVEVIQRQTSEVERLRATLVEEEDKIGDHKTMLEEEKDKYERLKTMLAEDDKNRDLVSVPAEMEKNECLQTMLTEEKDKNERLNTMLVEEKDKNKRLQLSLHQANTKLGSFYKMIEEVFHNFDMKKSSRKKL
uniref:Uncharacterized protein n=1 Tax=Oryza barthii TaxID=65489 RepID=A0A0D3HSD2_9ORYZ